jgi:hypothetical protein
MNLTAKPGPIKAHFMTSPEAIRDVRVVMAPWDALPVPGSAVRVHAVAVEDAAKDAGMTSHSDWARRTLPPIR